MEVRERAAARIANKFGLPDLREIDLAVDVDSKFYELGGYKDAKGTFHAVPIDEAVAAAADVDEDLAELPGENGEHAVDEFDE